MTIDWGEIFRPDQPFVETILRGTLTYLGIIIMMRLVLKRQSGSVGLSDLLLIVMIADASQNAMAGSYQSWPNGIVLVATLIVWNFILDWLGYRYQWVHTLLESPPTLVIRDGEPIHKNLEHEQITEDELLAELRMKGYSDYAQVSEARIEGSGRLSVLPSDKVRPRVREGQVAAPPGPSEHEAALHDFLLAADRLDAIVSWHEVRIEEHREFVKLAREEMKRHGVTHRKPRPEPSQSENGDADRTSHP